MDTGGTAVIGSTSTSMAIPTKLQLTTAVPNQPAQSGDSSPAKTDSPLDPITSVAFVPEACLFCQQPSSTLIANLDHMRKAHGLIIPASIDDNTLHLAVDMETLVRYMHLVICGYHECLTCGTQRADGWAVRQHMMGRGHCRIDLAKQGSEWRDFYQSSDELLSEEEEEDSLEETEESKSYRLTRAKDQPPPNIVRGANLHLSSGKVVMHRSEPAPKSPHHKALIGVRSQPCRHEIDTLLPRALISTSKPPIVTGNSHNGADTSSAAMPQTSSPMATPSSSPLEALTRADRRRLLAGNGTAITAAVATMSVHDRATLMHLSPAERRAAVIDQFKQQDRVQVAERKYWSKFERRQDRPAAGGKVYIGGG